MDKNILTIPKISEKEIFKRYKKVKPVVMKNGKLYWCRKFSDHEVLYTVYLEDRNADKPVKEGKLVPMEGQDFKCLHRYGFYLIFKPIIAEVLAQIPEEALKEAVAFEIIESPQRGSDFNKDEFSMQALNAGYHISTVRLYKCT